MFLPTQALHFGMGMARRMATNPWSTVNVLDDVVGARNAALLLPLAAYEAGHAQRGDRVATGAGGAVSLLAMPAAAWGTTAALRTVGFTFGGPIGGAAAIAAGIFLAQFPQALLRNSVSRTLRTLKNNERSLRRLELGGNYLDTQTNAAWRQGAVRDMGSAFQNARSYLGREGMFLHR